MLSDFLDDQSGATAIDYALIASVVSIAAGLAAVALGGDVTDFYTAMSTTLNNEKP